MGEPQAAAWRRSRKCCGALGPRCRFPLSAGARPRGLHGSGGASRRLPAAAAEELLRRPRLQAPRGPSWCPLSINDKVTSVSAQSPLSRRAQNLRITPLPVCGRRAMKNRSSSPPLHVHVDENTPVHVHIKKGQKTTPAKCQPKHKQRVKRDTVNSYRAARGRTNAPWVPPGKTSARESPSRWEGPTHRLEITPRDSEKMLSLLHRSDLSTDEEDTVHCRMNKYEEKIDSLMHAVGTLKSEAKLQKKEEQHEMRKRLLEVQKEQLNEVTQELVEKTHENTLLRRNIERLKEEKDLTLLQKKYLQRENECLKSRLSEAEEDAATKARDNHALKNTIERLHMERHMSSSDSNALSRQQLLLLQKLSSSEESNRTLRELLRKKHSREKDAQEKLEEQGELLKRLADSDAEKVQLQMRLQEREKEVDSLTSQLQAEKDQAKTAHELTKSLEAVKGRLQAQLRNKEAENNRLTTRIKNLERSEAEHKAEVERVMEQLQELRQKAEGDKEALEKATCAQEEQAERSEEYVKQLTAQVAEKDKYITEALTALESWTNRYNKVEKDKSDLEQEVAMLNRRVADLVEQKKILEDKMLEDREAWENKLRQTSETASFQMENERLQEKLNQVQMEVQQFKDSIRNYEESIKNYKSQVLKSQMEADDMAAKLAKCERENKALKDEMNKETELVRKQFQSQLAELENLPEILKMKETLLADCQDQLQNYEKKNMDLSAQVADLRQRIEFQGDKMQMTRERYQSAQEEKKQLTLKVEELERKLETTSAQNIEFLQVIAKREESIHQCQLRLEEKTRECSSLARQLEMAIEDARRQVEQTRERATSRERAAQSKMLDLETQLSRNKTELNQLRRNKEDAERRYESRLQDLKDRLEQSESTNRSMQNYVQFLKSSYDHVFGESALLGIPSRSRSSP